MWPCLNLNPFLKSPNSQFPPTSLDPSCCCNKGRTLRLGEEKENLGAEQEAVLDLLFPGDSRIYLSNSEPQKLLILNV